MLSLFPQLFAYQELAPLILRIVTGFIVISFAYPKLKKPGEFGNFLIGLVEFFTGALLVAGFLMQLAAALIILAMIFEIFRPSPDKDYKFMVLLIVVLVALMFLGPGFFAIDLPL